MPRRGVLICVAIHLEADAIARRLGLRFDPTRTIASGAIHVSSGIELLVRLQIVGVRAVQLPKRVDSDEIGCVISSGLAGALDQRLQCGDVVIDAAAEIACVAQLRNIHLGRIHTSDTVVATAAQKADLFRQTGALAVDMETAQIRRLADDAGVPFIALRAISDTADEAIEPAVLGLVDPLGRPRMGKVFAALSRRPGLLPQLLRLRSNSTRAAKRLAECLSELLQAMADASVE